MKTLLYARSRSYRGSPRPVLYGLLALLTVVFAAEPAAGQATALVPEPQTAAHAQAVDQAREFVREWMAEKICRASPWPSGWMANSFGPKGSAGPTSNSGCLLRR